MSRLAAVLTAGCLLLAPACGRESTSALDPADYVLVEPGALPVVLSAPHGGRLVPPGIPERTQGVTAWDINTLQLAQAIQARLEAASGRRARLVAGLVSRSYVDLNRVPAQAYEDPAMAPIYDAFHAGLRSAVDGARGPARALFVDLHGQSENVQVTFRGTQNGLTGDLALLCGDGGFLKALGSAGTVLVPGAPADAETAAYAGGPIVQTYGRQAAGGIDAVQLEFGLSLRDTPAALEATADRVAAAILVHLGLRAP